MLFKLSVNCTLVAVTGPTLAILNVNTVWYVVAFTFIKVDAVLAPATCWPKNVGLFSSGSFGSYYDGSSFRGIIFGGSTAIAGQVSFYVNSN